MDETRYRAAEQALWDHWNVAPVEHWVQFGTSGPRLRVLEVGDGHGSPVLFVHGATVAGSCWVDLASRLRDHRCLLLDRPGCGLSEPIRPAPSLPGVADLADELLAVVLDRLGVTRADLVTNSMGGLFGLRTAAAHPAQVRSITHFGWSLGAPVNDLPLIMRVATHRLLTPVAARLPASRASVRAMLRSTGLTGAVDTGRLPAVGIDWNVALQNHTDTRRHEFALGNGAGLREQMAALELEEGTLAAIAVPVRIVFGTADPFGTVPSMQALADRLSHGRLEVWEGAGHAPWLDDLDRAEQVVREQLTAA